LLGVFGAVASLHLFRAGRLEVGSNQYRVGWQVRSWIRPVLSWPDRYSTAMAIATTGSNRAVGILTGYGHIKSWPVHYVVLAGDLFWLTGYIP